jgi:hypothetical protein
VRSPAAPARFLLAELLFAVSVNPFLCSFARARLGGAMPNEGNKATGKPAAPAKPFTKSPVPAGVYAPAIGLCRDLSDCEDKLLGLLYS